MFQLLTVVIFTGLQYYKDPSSASHICLCQLYVTVSWCTVA